MKSRTELESLTESLTRAWNAHDAAALCAFYAPDADFVDETGAIAQGRQAIHDRHQEWFARIFARSSLAMNAIKLRFITPGTAVMHAVWSIRGVEQHHRYLPLSTGILLFVFVRRRGQWQVILSHSMAAREPAPM